MKITFKGETLADVIAQTEEFIKDYNCEIPAPTEKKKSGRPPETQERKAEKAAKIIAEVMAQGKELEKEVSEAANLMVGTTGLEPVAPKAPLVTPQPPSPPKVNLNAKKISKEDLVSGFQKIMESEKLKDPKSVDSNGTSLNGFNVVKGILARFGVKKLGELDEKRYHEMNIHIADALE